MSHVVKMYDNCHTCWNIFNKFEACPLYLWTGQEIDITDVAMFYSIDILMVVASLLPYFLGALIMLLALVRRKNYLICQAVVIGSQFVISRILKSIFKQGRPDCNSH